MPEIPITRPKRTTVQTRWIALARIGESYEARLWRDRLDIKSVGHVIAFSDPLYFFEFLKLHTNEKESYWCIGWNMYEILCRMGFYNLIKAGEINLAKNMQEIFGKNETYKSAQLYGQLVCENPPTIIDCRLANGAKVKFLDLENWGVTRKMIIEDGYKETIWDTVQAIEDYCALVRSLNMGELKATAATQGWYAYRYAHMSCDLIADTNESARSIERAAYFGGRNEAYRIGKLPGRIIHVDVSAMYTSFGFTNEFPCKLTEIRWKPSMKRIMEPKPSHQWIADVTVSVDRPMFPVRHEGRILYPVGEFRTTLAYPELCIAMWNGCVKKIHVATEYQCAHIFSCWAGWYRQSLEKLEELGLEHMKPALKLAVNAMYGKIGYRGRDWVDHLETQSVYDFGQWWQRHPINRTVIQWRAIEGKAQYLDAGSEPPRSMPSISATMNSYGRVHLWRLITIAKQENVYYCDTDGIMVSEQGYDNLALAKEVNSGEMGKLRIREASEDVEIFGLKHYRFGKRYCCSGVPDKTMMVHSDRVEFEQHTPFAYSLWQRKGFIHQYDKRVRTHKPKVKHGVLNPEGWVLPFVMAELSDDRENGIGNSRAEKAYGIMGSVDPTKW